METEPQSQEKQAWIVSLRLLAATPKSAGQLAGKLADKGFAPEVIQKTIDRLQEKGILSDRAFAQGIVTRLTESNLSGNRRIAFELKRKGIPAKVREEVLEKLDPEAEANRARELAQQKWERFATLDRDKRQKRVYDFLIRRGFDFQIVREVIEELGKK